MNTIRFEDLPTEDQNALAEALSDTTGRLITEDELRESRRRRLLEKWEREQRESLPS